MGRLTIVYGLVYDRINDNMKYRYITSISKNMMNTKTGISITEFFSYTMMVFGVFLDHVSTYQGLNQGLFESNILVKYCYDAGVWILLDVTLVIGVVATSYLVARASSGGRLNLVLIFPIILGIIRLAAGIWNLNIIL